MSKTIADSTLALVILDREESRLWAVGFMYLRGGQMSDYVTAMLSEKQAGGAELDEEIKKGIEASEAGDKAGAEAIFRQIVADHPETLEAWIWLGWTSANLDDSEMAFTRAAEIAPSNDEAQLGLRWVASQRGTPTTEGEFQTEMPEAPDDSAPETTEPVELSGDWDFDNAMKQAVRAARQGDKPTAYAMFRTLSERKPESAAVWVWYGGTSPRLEDAEAAFKRALELEPNNEEASLGLRWVALRRRVIERTGYLPTLPDAETSDDAKTSDKAAKSKKADKAEKAEKESFFAALMKKFRISLPILLMIVAVVVVWAVVAVWYLSGSN